MADKIQKEDLCSILMKENTMTDTKIHKILDAFFVQIMKGLEEERYVKIKGLGVFKLIDVESRRSVDVNTKEYIEIPEHRKVTFTPETVLKELINKPFAHFETIELKSEEPLDKTSSNIVKEIEDNHMNEEIEGNEVSKGMDVAVSEEIQSVLTTKEEVNMEEFTEKKTNTEKAITEEMVNVEETTSEKEVNAKEELFKEENTIEGSVENQHEGPVAVRPQDTTSPKTSVRLIERRDELRKLDKQLEEENRRNKIALIIISILMFFVLLAGILFILAPEFLEQLLY